MVMLKSWYCQERQATEARNYADIQRSRREYQTIKQLIRYFFGGQKTAESTITPAILDIGCGDKYIKFGFEESGWIYEGIDFDTCNIERDRLPFEDNRFDLVCSLAVIEHLADPSMFLKEAKRVCKIGGIIILSTPNWKCCIRDFYDDPTHIRPYTPESLKSLMHLAGFKGCRIVPNLRCKPKAMYTNKWAFIIASILPWRHDVRFGNYIPDFLKGRARGIFVICQVH